MNSGSGAEGGGEAVDPARLPLQVFLILTDIFPERGRLPPRYLTLGASDIQAKKFDLLLHLVELLTRFADALAVFDIVKHDTIRSRSVIAGDPGCRGVVLGAGEVQIRTSVLEKNAHEFVLEGKRG